MIFEDGIILPDGIVKRIAYGNKTGDIFRIELQEDPSSLYDSDSSTKTRNMILILGPENQDYQKIILESPLFLTSMIKALKQIEKEYQKIYLLNEL